MPQQRIVTMRLPQLQNFIKRDPSAYVEEFRDQHRNFISQLQIVSLKPNTENASFLELVSFMSHVAFCYQKECTELPNQLIKVLEEHVNVMTPHTRKILLQALILLKNRGLLDTYELLMLAFRLLKCQDKNLREFLSTFIVNDIKNMNAKSKNPTLNKRLQNFMYSVLDDENEICAKKSVDVMIELYKAKIWADARTVNILAAACLSKIPKVFSTAMHFFLAVDLKMIEEEEEEKNAKLDEEEIDKHEHSKKTKKRTHHVEKQKKRQKKRKQFSDGKEPGLFPAVQLIHDPQGLAEKVFKRLKQSTERFEVKLLMMNFISRLIGVHQLILLSFYSYLQRYMTSHQQSVTQILAYFVQSCHELIPPEEVVQVIKTIALNFVTDKCSEEVVAVGINTLREVVSRVPAVLYEPDMRDFVHDIALYSKQKQKSVFIAARSFIHVIREIYPDFLKHKFQGKFVDKAARPLAFGETAVSTGVDGIELLEMYEKGLIRRNKAGELYLVGDKHHRHDDFDDLEEISDEDLFFEDEIGNIADSQGENNDSEDNDDKNQYNYDEIEDNHDDENEEEDFIVLGGGDDDDENEEEDFIVLDCDDDDDEIDDNEKKGKEKEKVKGADETTNNKQKKHPKKSKKGTRINTNKEAEKSDDEVPQLVPIDEIKNRIDAKRILTDKDFELINELKQKAASWANDPKLRRKRKRSEMGEDEEEDDVANVVRKNISAVLPEDLEGVQKKKRASAEDRMLKVIEGKENFKPKGHAGGLTNNEKKRKKNFLMVMKSRDMVSKMKKYSKDLKREQGKKVKQLLKHDRRKRRRV